MISFIGAKNYFVACHRIDFRKSFDGLLAEAYLMDIDPFDGNVVIFVGRRKTTVKILACDTTGIWILAKRFSTAYVTHRFYGERRYREISHTELQMFLEGCSYQVLKRPMPWPDPQPLDMTQ